MGRRQRTVFLPIMRRRPATGKQPAISARRPPQLFRGVSYPRFAYRVTVAYRQHEFRIVPKAPDYTIFTFAIRPCPGQDYLMHLIRAPSCKRRGLRARHDGEPRSLGALPG